MDNKGNRASVLNAVYVWFLDDQNRVVWMDYTYVSGPLAPGESGFFVLRTTLDRYSSQVPAISQVLPGQVLHHRAYPVARSWARPPVRLRPS